VNTNKTHLLRDGRTSILTPYPNKLEVREKFVSGGYDGELHDDIAARVFEKTRDDEKPAMPFEDRVLLDGMFREFRKESEGKPEQWNFVPEMNPADSATRSSTSVHIATSSWLLGSSICNKKEHDDSSNYAQIDPGDKELKAEVVTITTKVEQHSSWLQRSQRFSSWRSFVGAVAFLRHVAHIFHERNNCVGSRICPDSRNVHRCNDSKHFIIGEVQKEFYAKELKCIRDKSSLFKDLAYKVLTTFMAEVCAIVNARPIVPASSDPEATTILSPSVLLTQKTDHVVDIEVCDATAMCRAQWKRVQVLADAFWHRWRRIYLHTLQNIGGD
jgi:hypothetical protein